MHEAELLERLIVIRDLAKRSYHIHEERMIDELINDRWGKDND